MIIFLASTHEDLSKEQQQDGISTNVEHCQLDFPVKSVVHHHKNQGTTNVTANVENDKMDDKEAQIIQPR